MKLNDDSSVRFPVELDDGREIVLYDPTEAVEEHAANSVPTKSLGGLSVDQGEVLPQDESGRTSANRSGLVVAVAKRGEEEVFSHLSFPSVLTVSASTVDEAVGHILRKFKRDGVCVNDFVGFDVTTHYYEVAFGKRECGWSFSFEAKRFQMVG